MITVKAKGFAQELAKLRALPKKAQREIEAEIQDSARQMVQQAKRDAPKDQGILVNEITEYKLRDLTWRVVSNADHSEYVEFGTKSKVRIPEGLTDYSKEVTKEKTSSLTAKEAIFNWCKRQGIEPRAWYAIYIAIMSKGIAPRPFFFKQIAVIEPRLKQNIQRIVNEQRL